LQFVERLLKRGEIEVTKVKGAVVQEYRAAKVAHQLYLSCGLWKGYVAILQEMFRNATWRFCHVLG
jgi:hypothetical protein